MKEVRLILYDPFIKHSRKLNYRDRIQISGCQGLEKEGGICCKGAEGKFFFFGWGRVMVQFYVLILLVATQQYAFSRLIELPTKRGKYYRMRMIPH